MPVCGTRPGLAAVRHVKQVQGMKRICWALEMEDGFAVVGMMGDSLTLAAEEALVLVGVTQDDL